MENPVSNGMLIAGIEIVVVEGGSELNDFIDLPWNLYAVYPSWVPPLKKEVRRLLDPRRHPFLVVCRAPALSGPAQFAGRWAGSRASSIIAIMSSMANRWAFGDSSNALTIRRRPRPSFPPWRRGLAGRAWPSCGATQPVHQLRGRAAGRGLRLSAGIDDDLRTRRITLRLVESCGFTKEKDLVAFLIDGEYRLPDWMERLAQRIAQKRGSDQTRRIEDMDAEFARIREIYNDSWSGNWGFAP